MRKVVSWWVRRPWWAAGLVTLLCASLLTDRLFLWDIQDRWFGYFFFGAPIDLTIGLAAAWIACIVLVHRNDPVRVLPLLIVVLSAVVWIVLPWDDVYMRLVWARHRQQYADIVTDFEAGRLVEGDHGAVLERTPEGLREVRRPEVWLNSESSLEPSVYFHVFGGSLLSGPMFGFLYAPQDEATLSREYWCGKLQDGWTRMKPHWYLVQD